MPTNCSAARQLTQFYKHSKSADLLRKSLLSHVWRVPSSKALSCKHERLFDLLTLASSNKRKTTGKTLRDVFFGGFLLPCMRKRSGGKTGFYRQRLFFIQKAVLGQRSSSELRISSGVSNGSSEQRAIRYPSRVNS